MQFTNRPNATSKEVHEMFQYRPHCCNLEWTLQPASHLEAPVSDWVSPYLAHLDVIE